MRPAFGKPTKASWGVASRRGWWASGPTWGSGAAEGPPPLEWVWGHRQSKDEDRWAMIIFNLFLFPYVHYGNIRNHKQAKMTAVNTLLYLLVSTFVPLSSHLCVCASLCTHDGFTLGLWEFSAFIYVFPSSILSNIVLMSTWGSVIWIFHALRIFYW